MDQHYCTYEENIHFQKGIPMRGRISEANPDNMRYAFPWFGTSTVFYRKGLDSKWA